VCPAHASNARPPFRNRVETFDSVTTSPPLEKNEKYRLLFSPQCRRKPGPNGPCKELIEAVVDMKRRNPSWGCPRIAQQMALAFGVEIDKDIVRRIVAIHDRWEPDVQSRDSETTPPKYLSSDHDPVYRFHQWRVSVTGCG
jgi:hypothetical protein